MSVNKVKESARRTVRNSDTSFYDEIKESGRESRRGVPMSVNRIKESARRTVQNSDTSVDDVSRHRVPMSVNKVKESARRTVRNSDTSFDDEIFINWGNRSCAKQPTQYSIFGPKSRRKLDNSFREG